MMHAAARLTVLSRLHTAGAPAHLSTACAHASSRFGPDQHCRAGVALFYESASLQVDNTY